MKLRILVVDDEPNVRKTLEISLSADGHQVVSLGSAAKAMEVAERASFDLAFIDLRLGTETGLDLLSRFSAADASMQLVMITAHGTVDAAVEAMKRGASDFLTKPFTPAQVRLVTERVSRLRLAENRISGLQAAISETEPAAELSSSSASMQRTIEAARQVASAEATVLLRGESGTGKGVLARAIHAWSARSAGPFVTVSCPALSAHLLESELFGHAKGAFTGATRDHPGRISIADGGTLFLDEVGDLPLEMQPKLLRFIQERCFERVGDVETRRADVRLVCATNVDLEEAVKAKRFREDLYYRINVFPIDVPPLRERAVDIVVLAEGMLAFFARGRDGMKFSESAKAAMRAYAWPGNVRELKNAVERAVILSRGDEIAAEWLPMGKSSSETGEVRLGDLVPFDRIEEAHIRRLLAANPSLEDAAAALDIDAATLWRKRRKFGI